jgi:predicted nucleic-acid-binding protein
MVGLDANVLLRFLAQDDPVQSPIATEYILTRCTETEPGFISLVALAETVWVLESVFGLPVSEVADSVDLLLAADTLFIQNQQEVSDAAVVFRSGRGDFADALIGSLGQWAACITTMTFDKRASRLSGLTLLTQKI